MIQDYLDARLSAPEAALVGSLLKGISQLVESHPPQKDVLIVNHAQGPAGELPWVYNREVLSVRWGSHQPIMVYQDDIFPDGDFTQPPDVNKVAEDVLKTAAGFPASQVSRHVVIDIENEVWRMVDTPHLKVSQPAIRKWVDLILAFKQRLPGFLIGPWSNAPQIDLNYVFFPDASIRRWLLDAWRQQLPVLQVADAVFPNFYFEPKPSPVPDFAFAYTAQEVAWAIDQCVTWLRSVWSGLLIYPSLWPGRYGLWNTQLAPDTPEQVAARQMPPECFRTVLGPCFAQADGAFLWIDQPVPPVGSGPPYVTWDWSRPWQRELEEYLFKYGVTPWSVVSSLSV